MKGWTFMKGCQFVRYVGLLDCQRIRFGSLRVDKHGAHCGDYQPLYSLKLDMGMLKRITPGAALAVTLKSHRSNK